MSIKQKLRGIPLIRRCIAYEEQRAAVIHDTYSVAQLAKLDVSFFPWTGSSLRPGSIRLLVNEIVIHQRRAFFEFGSGISTLYFAEMARRYEGRLVSVEQDSEWIEVVRGYLRESGTEDFVEFIHAPIKALPDRSVTPEWYETESLSAQLGEEKFDLVLVDAPISRKGHLLTRYPAGGFIAPYLQADFSIFLDDIHRKGEIQISHMWQDKYNWSVKAYWPKASVAIFRPHDARPYNIC